MSSAEPENKKRRRMQSENEKENNNDNNPADSFVDHSAPRGGRAFAMEVDKAVNERMGEKDKEFERVNGEIAFKNSLLNSQSEYLKKINNILHCSICMEHMIEPYGLSCGHVGCYECLHAWFTRSIEDDNHRKAKVCPSCRAPIRARPNELYIIKELVQIAASANNESISQPPQRTGDVWEGVFRPGGEYGPIEDREDGVLRCGRCSGELLHGICTMCGEIYTDAEDDDEEEEEEGEEDEEEEDEEVGNDPADELVRVSRLNLPFSIIGVSDSEHSSQRGESDEHDSDEGGNEHSRNSQNPDDESVWRGIRENQESESESDDFISDSGSVESRNRSGSRIYSSSGAPVDYIHSDDDEEEEEEEEASSTSSNTSSSRQSESESESEASNSSRETNPTRRHNTGVIDLSDDDNSGDGIPTSIPPRSRRRAIISDDDDDE